MDPSAVLLVDLQHDFLGAPGARMPVDDVGAAAVLRAANAVLAKRILPAAIPLLVVNRFPATARVANFFRNGAAISGTRGAELDARVHNAEGIDVIAKSHASGFTNPELEDWLRARGIRELYVLGVFAEGCIRSTVIDAVRRNYRVNVIADAVASNASWKKRFALWAMRRAGANIVTVPHAGEGGNR